ncbi:MAG: radical SAM protein [Candidatus Thermoplasmatota archaeon]|nr:radical SAM protein [Candidatus Thermoplasmatota archaeon]
MPKIVLTADRTLMSEYNKHEFLGFAACGPRFIPDWLYTKIFCPPVEEENGGVKYGHCGQRKIEAALLNNGFNEKDVAVVRPDRLNRVVDKETKVLCITTHDPLGLGPASTTFSGLGGRETFTSFYFRKLITDPVIRKYNLKVIVGGSGAWQLTDERIMAKLGIDSVVVGEGEITAVNVVEKALNGEKLPSFVQGEVVPLEQIPLIKNPTINGIIEICRGCGRGCKFCNPTMLTFRCQPIENILKEAKLNVDAGNGVLFHAEDVLRYNSKGFVPDEKAVLELFEEVKKLTDKIGISHFTHASAASKPSLIEKLSELMNAGSKECPFLSGQVGIETGSPRMVTKYMKGKAKPFKPEEWPEMIIESHKLLHDNHWVPVETLIIGLPGEKPEDTRKTIELVKDLSEFKSLIVPLYFVPIGNLQGNGFFRTKDTTPEHWQLLSTCINHDFKWVYQLAEETLPTVNMSGWKIWAIKKVARYMEKRLHPYLKLMEEGLNPATSELT